MAAASCDEDPSPARECPPDELIEAIHAAAFHFQHGPLSKARERLDRARALSVESDPTSRELVAALMLISRVFDEDASRAHLDNERIRMRLGDWSCLDPIHDRLHARLPSVQAGSQRPSASTVAVRGATFAMGCDPSRDPGCPPSERPAHPVSVEAFDIDRAEVTRAAYARCVAAGPCTPPARALDLDQPELPVADVTWQQARDFCRFVGRRLPTEAEWELAARGTDGRVYPWGDEPPTCALAQTAGCGGPAEVGVRPGGASPFGALDMAGNVDEWTEDVYAPYDGPSVRTGPGAQRVARGGAHDAWHVRATARMALDPDHHDATLGFRCAGDAVSALIPAR